MHELIFIRRMADREARKWDEKALGMAAKTLLRGSLLQKLRYLGL